MLFCQGWQVVQEPFLKGDVANSRFHLITYCTITVHFLSRYASVATNQTKVVFFELVLSGIWQKKCLSLFKVNYLTSSKA